MNASEPVSHVNFVAQNLQVGRKLVLGGYPIGYVDESTPTTCKVSFPPCQIKSITKSKITFGTDRGSVHDMCQALASRMKSILETDSEFYLRKKRSARYIAARLKPFFSKEDGEFTAELTIDTDQEYEAALFDADNRLIQVPAGKITEVIRPGMVARPILKFYRLDLNENGFIRIRVGLFQMKLVASSFTDTRSDLEVAQLTARPGVPLPGKKEEPVKAEKPKKKKATKGKEPESDTESDGEPGDLDLSDDDFSGDEF